MPRSLVSRSLEPLVAVLWGVFLVWTVWLAVVWIAPVGANALGFVDGASVPPNADLRGAVLLLANHADVIWLVLAMMNLHLVLTRAHGLRTARAWLAFSAGGALVLGVLNAKTGLPFGRLYFGEALGSEGARCDLRMDAPVGSAGDERARSCTTLAPAHKSRWRRGGHGGRRFAHDDQSGVASAIRPRLVGLAIRGCQEPVRRAMDELGGMVRRSVADGLRDAGKNRAVRCRLTLTEASRDSREPERHCPRGEAARLAGARLDLAKQTRRFGG